MLTYMPHTAIVFEAGKYYWFKGEPDHDGMVLLVYQTQTDGPFWCSLGRTIDTLKGWWAGPIPEPDIAYGESPE